ncbi:MAG: nucleotidyltransferase domain-containing protein [Planctomycetota bacterium]|nr:nucleotidyltransferase domain-containing protein [Planctomycetota bacterium]
MDFDCEKVARTCRREDALLLILFGSRAGSDAPSDSDTDLAVMLESSPAGLADLVRLEDSLREAMEITGRIDLVILNDTESTTLRREIVRTGKVLFDSDGEQFSQFAARAIRDFADFAPFRRLRRQVLTERFKP